MEQAHWPQIRLNPVAGAALEWTHEGGKVKWLYYVENEEDDVVLLKAAMKRVGCLDCVCWFQTGRELKTALALLPPTELPRVILLDLKLNGEYGLDIAAWLADQPAYKELPTFLFSSGRFMYEIVAALEKNTMGYLFKPSNFEAWVEIAQQLKGLMESNAPSAAAQLVAAENFARV